MPTRRAFLQNTSLMAAAALAAKPLAFAQPAHQPIGVQLYTVRTLVGGDLNALLAQIHAIGYEEVETFPGVYNHSAKELRKTLTDNGLRATSGHFDYDTFESKLDYASELGLEYMVCPMLPASTRTGDATGFNEAAERFNHFGQLVKARGMKFCFHNHNYEFRQQGTTTGYDILLQRTDPALVGFEMDCYWVTQAGRDPLEMLREHKGRIQLLHVKDRKPGFPPSQSLDSGAAHFTEVGNGTIAWPPILHLAESQGIRHFYVEQDQTDRTPLESLKISYAFLHKTLA